MNQYLLISILVAVLFLSSAGVIVIGNWIYKNGPFSKRQGRITSVTNPAFDEENVSPTRESKILSNKTFKGFRDWINKALSGLSSNQLQLKLSSAYWIITDIEYILIRIVATVLAFFLGWLIPGNILGGIFLSAIALMLPPILLDRAISHRQQKFHHQLLDVLLLIKGAVQAGYSFMQALDLAVKEIPVPASEEFGRVIREIKFGITLEGALINLADRMSSDDMQIVVTAIIINSQVGGNLSTVLESTITTIRDRMHLFGEIRSLTSYARYVGNFLTLMPFVTGFLIFLLSPSFFDTVKTSLITQIILLVALLGIIIGNIWIRQIVKIKV